MISVATASSSKLMDDEDRTPDLPTGEAWRIGLGARYDWSAQLV